MDFIPWHLSASLLRVSLPLRSYSSPLSSASPYLYVHTSPHSPPRSCLHSNFSLLAAILSILDYPLLSLSPYFC